MGFAEAVRVVLSKYVVFSGRARRSEYWWWFLFTFIVSLVASILDAALGTDFGDSTSGGGLLQSLCSLALFLPGLAVAIRRLHDTGRVGWWVLLALIPIIGWIVLLVFFVQDSQSGDNKYGPNPKQAVA